MQWVDKSGVIDKRVNDHQIGKKKNDPTAQQWTSPLWLYKGLLESQVDLIGDWVKLAGSSYRIGKQPDLAHVKLQRDR